MCRRIRTPFICLRASAFTIRFNGLWHADAQSATKPSHARPPKSTRKEGFRSHRESHHGHNDRVRCWTASDGIGQALLDPLRFPPWTGGRGRGEGALPARGEGWGGGMSTLRADLGVRCILHHYRAVPKRIVPRTDPNPRNGIHVFCADRKPQCRRWRLSVFRGVNALCCKAIRKSITIITNV